MTLLPPNEELFKRMNTELSQSQEITNRDLKLLREWLNKQPHLPKHIDDVRLERFLYGCKFSMERTKRMLDTYYTVRTKIPEFFGNRDPLLPEFQKCHEIMSYFILPNLTPEGHRVTILRLNKPETKLFDVQIIVKRIVMCLDARLLHEKCLNNVMVFDMSGMTMAHYVQVLPASSINRKAFFCIQDAFPMRVYRMHCLNMPPFIENVRALFAPLIKKKLMDKVLFHTGGYECLYDHMPREMLPQEYGGNAGTFQELNESWKRELENLRPWFLEEERLSKTDESKRPLDQNHNINVEVNGVNGSFRQLAID